MDDTMNLIWQGATHSSSVSGSKRGSEFSRYRGTWMTASQIQMNFQSSYGAYSSSNSGFRRGSWSWGTPERHVSFDRARGPSRTTLSMFSMSQRRWTELYCRRPEPVRFT